MDLRAYFQKAREVENMIEGEFTVVVSLETPDGGKPGNMTEVTKGQAARLVVDGRARLANQDEARDYYVRIESEREDALRREQEGRINVTLVTDRPVVGKGRQPKNSDR